MGAGGEGKYLQRNAAALALVRKRGGMQSVAFVPRGGGLARAMHAAPAQLSASHSVHLADAAFYYL